MPLTKVRSCRGTRKLRKKTKGSLDLGYRTQSLICESTVSHTHWGKCPYLQKRGKPYPSHRCQAQTRTQMCENCVRDLTAPFSKGLLCTSCGARCREHSADEAPRAPGARCPGRRWRAGWGVGGQQAALQQWLREGLPVPRWGRMPAPPLSSAVTVAEFLNSLCLCLLIGQMRAMSIGDGPHGV